MVSVCVVVCFLSERAQAHCLVFVRLPACHRPPPPPLAHTGSAGKTNKYGTGAGPGRDPTPKGGGGGAPPPPPSTDPKIVARNNVLCRRQRRRRFCFRHTAGGNFFVPPHVSILKILRILWRIQKWLKTTKRLCSHLAHFWATSDSAPRSEAEGLPETAGVK